MHHLDTTLSASVPRELREDLEAYAAELSERTGVRVTLSALIRGALEDLVRERRALRSR